MRKLLVSLSLVCALTACGSDTTTGRPVTLRTEVAADPEIGGAFSTATGWSVTLTKAQVSLGALYYFDGEPAFVMRDGRSLWQHLARALGPSIAYAHPGHYLAGMAMGQMTTPGSADLIAGVTALPDGNGISGPYRSARLVWGAPRTEPAITQLGGKVAVVEGSATKGEQTLYFKLSASFEDVARSVTMGHVDGCIFDEAEVDDDGLVRVTVKPHVWFDLVDFAGVAPGSAAAPTDIAATETQQIAFALGLVQLSAYRFSYAL